jgi:hypothetical protein
MVANFPSFNLIRVKYVYTHFNSYTTKCKLPLFGILNSPVGFILALVIVEECLYEVLSFECVFGPIDHMLVN